jgi:flagellar basal-body rod protein FlgF
MDASIIAYSAQKNLFDRYEGVANNIANVNTSGFKSDLTVYMKPTGTVNGKPNPIPEVKTYSDNEQGTLKATQRQFDAAIQGNGLFQVETPLGTRYTRAGNFFVDSNGFLVTKEGYTVAGDGGTITLNENDTTIRIADDGTIYAETPTGEEIRGKLGIFKFEDTSQLRKVGNSYFIADSDADTAEPQIDYTVVQGMLEDSNVDQIGQMTTMIDISRSVQNLARIVQDENQRIRNAVQRIAGVN